MFLICIDLIKYTNYIPTYSVYFILSTDFYDFVYTTIAIYKIY